MGIKTKTQEHIMSMYRLTSSHRRLTCTGPFHPLEKDSESKVSS